MPTVSVVVPTHNRADVLPRAIESVIGQTFDDFELVVVDDGSTDRTAAVVSGYDDPRVVYVPLEEHAGANAARNEGIRRSSGRFVSFLDSDDEFLPRHLQRVVRVLDRCSAGCVGAVTGVEVVDDREQGSGREQVDDGEVLDDVEVLDRTTPPADAVTYEDVLSGNVVGGFSSTTFHRACFDAVGLLDESLQSWQDFDFYLRVLESHSLATIEDVLVRYYERDDSISADFERKVSGQHRVLRKHRHRFTRETLAYWYYARAFVYAEAGDVETARRYFFRAFRTEPTKLRYLYHLLASLFGSPGFAASVAIKRELRRVLRS